MICCGETMCGVQYDYGEPGHYDGVSEYKCLVCGKRVGRMSEVELQAGECDTWRGVRRREQCPTCHGQRVHDGQFCGKCRGMGVVLVEGANHVE